MNPSTTTLTIYTFTESGGSTATWREIATDQAAEQLEAATAQAEQHTGRTRIPYSDELGTGFQVGTGNDPSYQLVLLDHEPTGCRQ